MCPADIHIDNWGLGGEAEALDVPDTSSLKIILEVNVTVENENRKPYM